MAIRFAIEGDLRFLSHHDVMRLFERALARADLPVRFTEGFNPHSRLSLPLPRNVGVASEDELLLVELDRPVDPSDVLSRLSRQTPKGITLLRADRWTHKGTPQPRRVAYAVDLNDADAADLQPHIDALLAARRIAVERSSGRNRPVRTVDIRPYLAGLVFDPPTLRFELHVSPEGTARPAEVLHALGLQIDQFAHRLRRLAVNIEGQDDPSDPACARATASG